LVGLMFAGVGNDLRCRIHKAPVLVDLSLVGSYLRRSSVPPAFPPISLGLQWTPRQHVLPTATFAYFSWHIASPGGRVFVWVSYAMLSGSVFVEYDSSNTAKGHFSGRPPVSDHEAVFPCMIAASRETLRAPSGVVRITVQSGFNDPECLVWDRGESGTETTSYCMQCTPGSLTSEQPLAHGRTASATARRRTEPSTPSRRQAWIMAQTGVSRGN